MNVSDKEFQKYARLGDFTGNIPSVLSTLENVEEVSEKIDANIMCRRAQGTNDILMHYFMHVTYHVLLIRTPFVVKIPFAFLCVFSIYA
jgi:hypothetical protein